MVGTAIPPRGLLIATAQSWRYGSYDILLRDRGQRGLAAELRYTSHAGLKTRTAASLAMPIGVVREVAAALLKAADEAEHLIGGADAAARE